MDYRIRWQQRRKQRRQKQLLAIPAVLLALGLLYALVRLLGNGGGTVHWVHERAGQTAPRIAAGPALVYTLWSSGHILALGHADGRSITEGPFFSVPEVFNATPLLADHVLYFGSDLGLLHAIDSKTGLPLWEFNTLSPLRAQPLLAGGRLYVGNDDGKVYCFTPDGKKLWVARLPDAISGQAAVVGKTLIVATIRGLVCGLSANDGTVLWKQALQVPVLSPVTAAGSLVLVGSDTGALHVLQAGSGKPVKQYYTEGLVRGAVAVGPHGLYFGSTDGWLRVISTDGKNPLWAKYLGGPVSVGPVLAGETLYVGRPGRLFALDPRTGKVRRAWHGEQFSGDLVVTEDAVYTGTTTGRLLALVAP